ncbi:hypothetical protein QVA66_06585 [Staphylococcus chromogenes]|nr:hypothetical protein [Staphylococcus chromogenes]
MWFSVNRVLTVAVVPLAAGALVACDTQVSPPAVSTSNALSSVATAEPTLTTTSSPSSRSSSSHNPSERIELGNSTQGRDLKKVTETFASLAPKEFFEKFSSCDSNGIPDSYSCTGPDVGQFQFIVGDAKAASTTQLLTELRSSRVVEDSGDRIVGWSTLGTTAVITVVDNKKGLTMQQMVSSDKQDPLKRIKELGLVKSAETTSPSPTAETSPEPTSGR